MTDEEFVFRRDVHDKKVTARSAFHKKNGSKSKKCSLPSDYMTKKERLAMNGDVTTINFNTRYDWKVFKKFSEDLQKEYILNIRERYSIGIPYFAKLFGVCDTTVFDHFKKIGMPPAEKGMQPTRRQIAEFEDWLDNNSLDGSGAPKKPSQIEKFEKRYGNGGGDPTDISTSSDLKAAAMQLTGDATLFDTSSFNGVLDLIRMFGSQNIDISITIHASKTF